MTRVNPRRHGSRLAQSVTMRTQIDRKRRPPGPGLPSPDEGTPLQVLIRRQMFQLAEDDSDYPFVHLTVSEVARRAQEGGHRLSASTVSTIVGQNAVTDKVLDDHVVEALCYALELDEGQLRRAMRRSIDGAHAKIPLGKWKHLTPESAATVLDMIDMLYERDRK